MLRAIGSCFGPMEVIGAAYKRTLVEITEGGKSCKVLPVVLYVWRQVSKLFGFSFESFLLVVCFQMSAGCSVRIYDDYFGAGYFSPLEEDVLRAGSGDSSEGCFSVFRWRLLTLGCFVVF